MTATVDGTAIYADAVLGTRPGFLAVAFGYDPYYTDDGRYRHRSWTERRYRWPDEREALHTDVSRMLVAGERVDVYVCPAVRFTDDRRKGSARPPVVCWVDLDGPAADPDLLARLDPLLVESGSDGHRHGYVLLSRPVDLGTWNRIQPALRNALGGAADDKIADNDLLRLPGTLNHKTDPPTVVTPLPWSGRVWEPEDLAELLGVDLSVTTAAARGAAAVVVGEPAPDPLPALVRWALDHPEVADRSAAHHRLVGACRRAGLTAGQTLTVAGRYPPSVEKYGDRLAAEVDRSWWTVDAPRADRDRFYDLIDSSPPRKSEQEQQAGEPAEESTPPALVFQTLAELAAEVDAAGPRRWLLRGVWPAGDYGVHAAEQKAQKTWNTADLVVSVASGTRWLGAIEVDAPGPVLMFVGEGGKANTVRRLRAVAEVRGVVAETLPIVVCTRAPHLSDRTHLQLLAEQVHTQRPVLVTLDPLYLSAAGASLADLYAMGALLEAPQRICQGAGAALWIVTHFNRKQGSGAGRITGAGPAEWGRVLISAEVKSRRTDPDTRHSDVVTLLEVIGGEVPDRALTLHRRIWSDNPDDLDAPLHLECTVTEDDTPEGTETGAEGERLSPAAVKLLEALREAAGPRSAKELVDAVAARHGHGLTRQTTSKELNALERAGLAESIILGPGMPKNWLLVDQINDHDDGQNSRSDLSATPLYPSSSTPLRKTAGQTRQQGVADASAATGKGGVVTPSIGGVTTPDTPPTTGGVGTDTPQGRSSGTERPTDQPVTVTGDPGEEPR